MKDQIPTMTDNPAQVRDGAAVSENVKCSHCSAIFTRRDWTADNFDRPIPRCQFCGSSGEPQTTRTIETRPMRSCAVSDYQIVEICQRLPLGCAGFLSVEAVRYAIAPLLASLPAVDEAVRRDAAKLPIIEDHLLTLVNAIKQAGQVPQDWCRWSASELEAIDAAMESSNDH